MANRMPRQVTVTTLCLHKDLLAKARKRAVKLGFVYSFSAYMAHLITLDIQKHGKDDGRPG